MADTSPLPVEPTPGPKAMSFFEAMKHVAVDKKVSRSEWNDKEYYGFLNESRLSLHKPDGSLHDWIVSEGDMLGSDWIVV